MTPCLTVKAFFLHVFPQDETIFYCQISANFVPICLVQTGLFYQIGNVLWVLMSTLLSAACHLVAMICIVTPWFICTDRIGTDKLFCYSYLQFIENKQTNNSIRRVYYLLECLDWTRLVFRVLLLAPKKIQDVKTQVKVYTLLSFRLQSKSQRVFMSYTRWLQT